MRGLDDLYVSKRLPRGLTLEKTPAFVPRMVMTDELEVVFREVISQWTHREKFAPLARFGIRPLDRLLFYGPPGNGKTLACQWICQKLDGVPLYRVQCEAVIGQYMGNMAQGLAGITNHLRALAAPAVCLFDEVESIFVDRTANSGQCDRERATALSVFFQALDRWEAPTLIVMCTNIVDQLDRALLSRVELQLQFGGPTPDQALQVVEYWRELLCEHGADEWGPRFVDAIQSGQLPESFRELTQLISRAARDWVARGIS